MSCFAFCFIVFVLLVFFLLGSFTNPNSSPNWGPDAQQFKAQYTSQTLTFCAGPHPGQDPFPAGPSLLACPFPPAWPVHGFGVQAITHPALRTTSSCCSAFDLASKTCPCACLPVQSGPMRPCRPQYRWRFSNVISFCAYKRNVPSSYRTSPSFMHNNVMQSLQATERLFLSSAWVHVSWPLLQEITLEPSPRSSNSSYSAYRELHVS